MANTRKTRLAAREALAVHAREVGNQSEPEETKIVDLIADLLLLLSDDETAEQVAALAATHAALDRA